MIFKTTKAIFQIKNQSKLKMSSLVESFLSVEFANNCFYSLFRCSWATFKPFLRGPTPCPILITPFYQFLAWGSPGTLWKGRVTKPGRRLMGFKQRTFWFNCNVLTQQATLCRPLTTYVSNSVIRLMVKFCLSTKIVFQVSCFLSKTKRRTDTGIWKLCRWNSYCYSNQNS